MSVMFLKILTLSLALLVTTKPSLSFAQGTDQTAPYSTIFYGTKPPSDLMQIISKGLGSRVQKTISAEEYDLIVFAEANSVAQKKGRARVCSVTVGFSKKSKSNHAIPNVRFNSIGFSIDEELDTQRDISWEQKCVKNSLAKALEDLSQSDLDYIMFMTEKR